MKHQYRYTLEPYKGPSTRYSCPGCGKKKTFTRYIDTRTGEHLPEQFGRCDREVNCGYHAVPKFKSQNSKPFKVKSQNSKPKSYNWLNPNGGNASRKLSTVNRQLPTQNFSTIPLPFVRTQL